MKDKKKDKIIIKKDEWKPYKNKIKLAIVRISLYLLILFILISFTAGLSVYKKTLFEFDNKNINELNKFINTLNRESSKTQKNLALAQKYNERWKNADDNKKDLKGISPNFINALIEKTATKYNIYQYNFSMSVPQRDAALKDKDNKIINIFHSDCQISFKAADDIRAISFFNDLKENLTGYVVINSFSLDKNKDYEFDDLLKISSGTHSGLLNVSIRFKWYVAKKI